MPAPPDPEGGRTGRETRHRLAAPVRRFTEFRAGFATHMWILYVPLVHVTAREEL